MKTTNTTAVLEKLVTTDETAALIGVEVRTIEDWRRRGRYSLPFIRIGPNIVRYRPADVAKFMEKNTVQLAMAKPKRRP